MASFFLIVEILSYIFLIYVIFAKKELAIVYLPAFMFARGFAETVLSASVYYGVVSFLLISCIIRNTSFFRNNIFALLIIVYFAFLIPKSSDLEAIRPYLFSVFWLFISIPLIAEISKKYNKEELFEEVSNSALLILILFIINVVFSTVYRFAPTEMYGITSGILYGHLFATDFNVLAIAIFLTTLKFLKNKKTFLLAVLVISLAFLMLSMRRSVMSLGVLGVGMALLTLVNKREVKKFVMISCAIFLIGYIIYTNTDFMSQFNERYALRNLDDRALEEEGRFLEYQLLYEDMFVHNDYSPWVGFELFNSEGNYGRKIFEMRSLHADLASIAHSSGIIGVLLYLLMVTTVFMKSFRAIISTTDKLLIFFCAIVFVLFTITGRFTELDSMLLLFLTLQLPLANESSDIIDSEVDVVESKEIAIAG